MLYTKKGDNGTTKIFGCDQRISKSSAIAEALGSLDEINSFLGLCKIKVKENKLKIDGELVENLLHETQENLFIVQAELAGAKKTISEEKVLNLEKIIGQIEKELPPFKTFFISGGTELAALFDVARTIARRAERRVVAVADSKDITVGKFTLSYMNRLSSILYALTRFANHKAGVKEKAPEYK
ncbi:MAG: cob(I)yrinic acid a,c-diamide adenosyltransferase [Candidatus Paceibacterota bacterium]|jgi:cob(I)alamin adenosyltransferase